MDFNKISTFVKVAELGSVTKAAKELFRSQSAISQQIQALEDDLELKLFERKQGQVYLTVEGEKLFKMASKNLSDLSQGILGMQDQLKNISGTIKIGHLGDSSTTFPLEKRIAQFALMYPVVNINLHRLPSWEIEEKLLNNVLDIGFLINFKKREFFNRRPLEKSEHIVVTSSQYLKKYGPLNTGKKLLDSHLIDFNHEFLCFRPWFKKHYKSLVSSLDHIIPAMTATDHQSVKKIIESGMGIGVLPRDLIKDQLAKGRIVEIFPKKQGLTAILDLATRKVQSDSVLIKTFIDFMIKTS